MNKLTPQNKHQEHMIQILLAKMQGLTVERKINYVWSWSNPNDIFLDSEYRIAQKPTPLPITREIWAMIAEEWKWASMDKSKDVNFFTHEPAIYKPDGIWGFNVGNYCQSILAINTNGINWEQSLTKRPEDV
ncbi:hypothetical protein A9G48_00515 [Gilliamella sp. wkB18]|uniref:hypothetical protein n=1 Tax=Gilliamella sp. wkB18 TaxID=3120260 RepID=UPI0004DCF7C9|nr:hypothetical protein [Gilliamella apicola]KFA58924.1 hypothetical protein GAPWKB11_0813 [Gilliamella apicola]OCG65283.1 hypothetical protein A9G48_00515 [Gilliamella apicola]